MGGDGHDGDGVEGQRIGDRLGVEIVLKLRRDVAGAERGISAARALPGKAGRGAVPRGLGGAEAVEGESRSARGDSCVGEAVAGGETEAAEGKAGVQLEAAARHR